MSKLTGPEALSLLLYVEGDRESTIRKLTAVRGELAADEEWLKKVLDGLQEKIRQMPEAVFQDCILHAEEYLEGGENDKQDSGLHKSDAGGACADPEADG